MRSAWRMVAASLLIGGVALANPPSVPTEPFSPPAGDKLGTTTVRFNWSNSTDPTGLALRYEIEVLEVVAGGKEARPVAHATGGDGAVGVVSEGLPTGPLSWRVRAVNTAGEISAWSAFNGFTITAPPVTSAPADMPGCAIARGRSASDLALFALSLASFALVLWRRRR